MDPKLKKYALLLFIISLCSFLNYHPQMLFGLNSPHWGWALSLLATILIFSFMRLRDPKTWKQKLGITFEAQDYWQFLVLTIVLLILSYFVVNYVASLSAYHFKPKLFFYKTHIGSDYPFHYVLASYIYYLPATFNEEMLVGALLLFGIERHFKRWNKSAIAIFVALVFSLMHQALYKWSPVQSGELLTLSTIISLFFVGVLRNSLILKTRKIVYSWAIHLSFNMVFFSGFFVHSKNQKSPGEPEVFNIIFGNPGMLALTGTLAVLALLWMNNFRFNMVKK